MKRPEPPRRVAAALFLSFAAFAHAAALHGCGGGLGGVNGGIGGSGIVVGPIEELGSIVVDGIRFDIDAAEVMVNGEAGDAADLDVGMFVSVHGEFDEESMAGLATLVEFEETVTGPIASVAIDRSAFVVLGQAVRIDEGTRLAGLPLEDLEPGVVVSVSGSRDADGAVLATRLEKRAAARNCRLVGEVEDLADDGSTFRIGEVEVDAEGALVIGGELAEGDSVAVLAQDCDQEGRLAARQIRRLAVTGAPVVGEARRLRGFVIARRGAGRFFLRVPGEGRVVVRATASTVFEGGTEADVSRNDLLVVNGLAGEAGLVTAARVRFLRDVPAQRPGAGPR